MSGTKDKILDSAERLIQSRGFSAISYRDIAEEVGIRKASIHYYFPSKSDMAIAVLARYRDVLAEAMEQSVERHGDNALAMLDDYFAVYLSFEDMPDKICLCGALAGDYPVLSKAVQAAVDEFFQDHEIWIAKVLEAGERLGQFRLIGGPKDIASWVLVSLQGALIVGRATNSPQKIKDVQTMVRKSLTAVDQMVRG